PSPQQDPDLIPPLVSRTRTEVQGHLPVRNARVHEDIAAHAKSLPLIEADRLDLCPQLDRREAAFARDLEQRAEHCPAHASPAPFLQHRHPTDLALPMQPPRADPPAAGEQSQYMYTGRVEAVRCHRIRH